MRKGNRLDSIAFIREHSPDSALILGRPMPNFWIREFKIINVYGFETVHVRSFVTALIANTIPWRNFFTHTPY